jgi:hypothetical protein
LVAFARLCALLEALALVTPCLTRAIRCA